MSKKSQTTGQPKRRRRSTGETVENTSAPQQQIGYKRRAEREEEIQKRVIWGTGITIGILLLVILIAFAYEQLIVPNTPVANVNGETITAGQFRERVEFEQTRLSVEFNQLQNAGIDINQLAQQEPWRTYLNELNFPDQLGQRVLDDMVEDILLRQEAESRSVSVDDSALEAQIETYFNYDPTEVALIGVEPTATTEPTETSTPFVSPTPSPTPTLTPTLGPDETEEAVEPTITPQPTFVSPTLSADEIRDNFQETQENFRQIFATNGIGSGAVDDFFRRSALEEALKEQMFADQESLTYVNARHILVDSEEVAQDVIDALENGESFADLAAAVSTDTGSGARGGELGWSYTGNYVEGFREAVETAEIGTIVGPVESEFGFHIIQVRAREERSGEEIENEIDTAKDREFARFVEELHASNEANIEIYDSWIDFVPR